jgi:hypothetical protein
MEKIQYDVRTLTKQPEFSELTVEEAIRLLGEKEKARLIQDRDKALGEIRSKLDDKVHVFKSTR